MGRALIHVGYFILQKTRRFSLKKQLLVGTTICLMLFLLVCIRADQVCSSNGTALSAMASNVGLTIDYGNSSQNVYSDLSGLTVFDILNQTAGVTFIEFAYGKFVVSINGVENNANQNGFYWQYWVNDELAPIAADNYVLSDDDQVLWKYCAPEETSTPPPTANPDMVLGVVLVAFFSIFIILLALFVSRRMR